MDLRDYINLDPVSRGELFFKTKEKEKISYQQIAKKIGKSLAYIVNSVRLLELPEAVKDGVWGGLISEGHARTLLSIKDLKECIEVYKLVLREHSSVRETEELVRQKVRNQTPIVSNGQAAELKKHLSEFFNRDFSKVAIKQKRKSVTVVLLEE